MKKPIRVVVIDDDLRIRESLGSLFEAAQIDAKFFPSAEDFLRLQQLEEVSCLVSDVKMPGMSGYDLQSLLLQVGVQIPMIFITAHPLDWRSQEALDRGAIAILQKPFDGEELLEQVEQAIQSAG